MSAAALLVAALLLPPAASAQEAPPAEPTPAAEATPEPAVATAGPAPANPWDKDGWGWGGVPAVAYNSDDGLGGGVLGSIYRYREGVQPYKWSSTLLLYVTTKGVHTHRVDFDLLEVGGAPLRLSTRTEFAVTRSSNYCGLDPSQFCDPDDALKAADAQGLEGEAREDFLLRYHKVRMLNPNGFLSARYALDPMPHKLELMASWWGGYYLDGDLSEVGPFPGSLYDQTWPHEPGFLSALQAGVMLDNRDNEPAPTEGYWIEGSVRGASPFWGSNWSYFGYNLTLRGYQPFTRNHRLVGTARVVADGILGEVPYFELTRAGGSQIYWFFGGQRAGRGVRTQGITGKVRFMAQPELRWTWLSKKAFNKVNIDLTAIFFSDIGLWATDWATMDQRELAVTEGVGMRWAFNKNFIIRTDVGFSALEGYAPGIYIDVGNLW
jgi:hypothetical protein